MTIVVATSNPGKLREFRQALAPAGFDVVGVEALDHVPDVLETGSTFEENARLKAEAYSRHTELPVLADDSGLEVDALGGAPGVHSARYGGEGLDDAGRVRVLLRALDGIPRERRAARFVCALVMARAGRQAAIVRGSVEGLIADEPRGAGGFGYDPVFFHPPSGCTFAELDIEAKRRVSHRGRAIEAFLRLGGIA
jgi:XTP/dITP diphosphohydrolase